MADVPSANATDTAKIRDLVNEVLAPQILTLRAQATNHREMHLFDTSSGALWFNIGAESE
jgi:hypothetical protein